MKTKIHNKMASKKVRLILAALMILLGAVVIADNFNPRETGFDARMDCDVDGDIDEQDNSKEEDPGKIMLINSCDTDADNIVDYLDGFDLDGTAGTADDTSTASFYELELHLTWRDSSSAPDLNQTMISISYSASNPDPDHITDDEPADGHLRIWTKDGNEARDWHSIAQELNPGDFIPSNTSFKASKLAFSGTDEYVATVYVEAVNGTSGSADWFMNFGVVYEEIQNNTTISSNSRASDKIRYETMEGGLSVDLNHDGEIDQDDNPGEAAPGAIMLAGYGLDNHPDLEERIEMKILVADDVDQVTLGWDNELVQVFKDKDPSADEEPLDDDPDSTGTNKSVVFGDETDEEIPDKVYVKFYTDEVVNFTLTIPNYPCNDTLRITRLSNGLGAPDGIAPVKNVIPGRGYVNLMNGNFYFGAVARVYNTPALGPDLAVSYNHLDGIAAGSSGLGRGWRTNYDLKIIDGTVDDNEDGKIKDEERSSDDIIALIDETGARRIFKYDSSAANPDEPTEMFHKFESEAISGLQGAIINIVTNKTEYTLLRYELNRHDNHLVKFKTTGEIDKIENLRGEKLTIDSGSVTDDYSRTVSLTAPGNRDAMNGLEMGDWSFTYEMTPATGVFLDRIKQVKITDSLLTQNSHTWEIGFGRTEEDPIGKNKVVEVKLPEPDFGAVSQTYKLDVTYTPDTAMKASTSATVAGPYDGMSETYSIDGDLNAIEDYTNPVSVKTTFDVDDDTRLLDKVTRGKFDVTMDYDDYGMLTSRDVSSGPSERWTYDKGGVSKEYAWLLKDQELVGSGGKTRYTYWTEDVKTGRVKTITDPCNAETSFEYDEDGFLSSTEDADSKTWTFSNLTAYGQPQTTNAPDITGDANHGTESSTSYSDAALGLVGSTTDVWGYTTSYAYDSLKRVNSITHPGSVTVTTDRDIFGNVVNTKDRLGHEVSRDYDAWGRLTEVSQSELANVTTTYELEGDYVTVTTEQGTLRLSKQKIDFAGRPYRDFVKRHDGTSVREAVRQYTYDGSTGWMEKVSRYGWGSPSNNFYEYTRDDAGRVTDVKDPEGHTSSSTYYPPGWLKSRHDADNVGEAYEYDKCGRRTKVTNSKGGSITTVYNRLGQVKSVTLSNSRGTSYEYYEDGMLKWEKDVFGKKTEYSYNTSAATVTSTYAGLADRAVVQLYGPKGFVNSTTTAFGTTTYSDIQNNGFPQTITPPDPERSPINQTQDGLGRWTGSTISPGGDAEDISSGADYDPDHGWVAEGTSPLNNVTKENRVAETGEVNSSQDTVGGEEKIHEIIERSANGETLKYKGSDGKIVELRHDNMGRVIWMKGPDEVLYQWQHTPGGRVWATKRAGIVQTITEFDPLGQPESVLRTDGLELKWTYDKFGKMLTSTVGGKTTTHVYDPYTQILKRVITPEGMTRYEHDSLGQITEEYYNGRRIRKNTWLDNGLLDKVEYKDGKTEDYVYKANGDVDYILHEDGSRTVYIYDGAGRVIRKEHKNAQNVKKQSADIDLDPAGNKTGETVKNYEDGTGEGSDEPSITRTFNKRGYQTEEKEGNNTVTFDRRNDNRLNAVKINGQDYLSYTYDAQTSRLDTITDADGRTAEFTYDAKGRISRVDLPNNVNRQYSWDEVDRMIWMRQVAGATTEDFQYKYDDVTGLLTDIDGPGYDIHYEYWPSYRLKEEVRTGVGAYERSYTYDNQGNRTTMRSVDYGGTAPTTTVEQFDGTSLPGIADILTGSWTLDQQAHKLLVSTDLAQDWAKMRFNVGAGFYPQVSAQIEPDPSTYAVDKSAEFGIGIDTADGRYTVMAEVSGRQLGAPIDFAFDTLNSGASPDGTGAWTATVTGGSLDSSDKIEGAASIRLPDAVATLAMPVVENSELSAGKETTFWFKPDALPAADTVIATRQDQYALTLKTDGALTLTVKTSADDVTVGSDAGAVTAAAWQRIILRNLDGTVQLLTLDAAGELTGIWMSAIHNSVAETIEPLVIGGLACRIDKTELRAVKAADSAQYSLEELIAENKTPDSVSSAYDATIVTEDRFDPFFHAPFERMSESNEIEETVKGYNGALSDDAELELGVNGPALAEGSMTIPQCNDIDLNNGRILSFSFVFNENQKRLPVPSVYDPERWPYIGNPVVPYMGTSNYHAVLSSPQFQVALSHTGVSLSIRADYGTYDDNGESRDVTWGVLFNERDISVGEQVQVQVTYNPSNHIVVLTVTSVNGTTTSNADVRDIAYKPESVTLPAPTNFSLLAQGDLKVRAGSDYLGDGMVDTLAVKSISSELLLNYPFDTILPGGRLISYQKVGNTWQRLGTSVVRGDLKIDYEHGVEGASAYVTRDQIQFAPYPTENDNLDHRQITFYFSPQVSTPNEAPILTTSGYSNRIGDSYSLMQYKSRVLMKYGKYHGTYYSEQEDNTIVHFTHAFLNNPRSMPVAGFQDPDPVNAPQFTSALWANKQRSFVDDQQWVAADFNQDGVQDLVRIHNRNGSANFEAWFSTSFGFDIQQMSAGAGAFGTPPDVQWFAGRFDINSQVDIAKVYREPITNQVRVDVYRHVLQPEHVFLREDWDIEGAWEQFGTWMADNFYLLSGRTDLAHAIDREDADLIDVHVNNEMSGLTSFTQERWEIVDSPDAADGKWLQGDFSGDVKTDIAYLYIKDGMLAIDVYVNELTSFTRQEWSSNLPIQSLDQKWLAMDVDLDRKDDICSVLGTTDGVSGPIAVDVYKSDGSSFSHARWAQDLGSFDPADTYKAGDFDGDGDPDIVRIYNDNGSTSVDFLENLIDGGIPGAPGTPSFSRIDAGRNGNTVYLNVTTPDGNSTYTETEIPPANPPAGYVLIEPPSGYPGKDLLVGHGIVGNIDEFTIANRLTETDIQSVVTAETFTEGEGAIELAAGEWLTVESASADLINGFDLNLDYRPLAARDLHTILEREGQYRLSTGNNGILILQLTTLAGVQTLVTSGSVTAGSWNHIQFAYHATGAMLRLNDEIVTESFAVSTPAAGTAPLTIGGELTATIDNLRLGDIRQTTPDTEDIAEYRLVLRKDGVSDPLFATSRSRYDKQPIQLQVNCFDGIISAMVASDEYMTPLTYNAGAAAVAGQTFTLEAKAGDAFALGAFDNVTWRVGDPANPPSGPQLYEYTYDPDMNLLEKVRKNGVLITDCDYDDRRRMTARVDEGVTTTFAYDYYDRVTGLTKTQGGATTEAHEYHYAGESALRTSAALTKDGSTTTTDYVWDGFNCLRQTTGSVITNYTYSGDSPLWQTTNTGAEAGTSTFLNNGRGNITGLYNGADTAQQRSYDAYGNEKNSDPTAFGPHYSRIGYRAQLLDVSTGYNYMRARLYDPNLGRFLIQDPINHGKNWQIYANADPVNKWDPTGWGEFNIDGVVQVDTTGRRSSGGSLDFNPDTGFFTQTTFVKQEYRYATSIRFLERGKKFTSGFMRIAHNDPGMLIRSFDKLRSAYGVQFTWERRWVRTHFDQHTITEEEIGGDEQLMLAFAEGFVKTMPDIGGIWEKVKEDPMFAVELAKAIGSAAYEKIKSDPIGFIKQGISDSVGELVETAVGVAEGTWGVNTADSQELQNISAYRAGIGAGHLGKTLVAIVGAQLVKKIVQRVWRRIKLLRIRKSLPKFRDYRPGQGFSGIYNPETGKFHMRPSTAQRGRNIVPPEGWVRRTQGHRMLRDEWITRGGLRPGQKPWAFTAILDESGNLRLNYRSISVNGGVLSPERQALLRQALQDVLGKGYGVYD